MRQPAAKEGDSITGIDMHKITPPGATPTPSPFKFDGTIEDNLSPNVNIMGKRAATVGSTTSKESSGHTPDPPPSPFTNPPENKGTIVSGSNSVKINEKAAARNGDAAETCTEVVPAIIPNGKVVASGTVMIG